MASAYPQERRIMGVWIFDLADADAARQLYADLPAPLKTDAELRLSFGSGHLLVTSQAGADWVRERAMAA